MEKLSELKKLISDQSRATEYTHKNEDFSKTKRGSKKMGWEYWDSSSEKFDKDFKEVLPEGCLSLNDYIQRFYANKKGKMVGILLGGPGIKLFQNLSPDYFSKTAGVLLTVPDLHTDSRKHRMIKADIFHKRKSSDQSFGGFQDVVDFTKEEGKADILIESMEGGIGGSQEYDLFILYLSRWYGLLSEVGTMFVKFPPMNFKDRMKCNEHLLTFLESYPKFFDFNFLSNMDNTNPDIQALRLRKLVGSPNTFMSMREIYSASQKFRKNHI